MNFEDSVRGKVLRPLGDAFGKLTRDIEAGKYPKDIPLEDAMMVTENYIDSAWNRLDDLIDNEVERRMNARREF